MKTFLIAVEVDGKPTTKEVQGRKRKISGYNCFIHREDYGGGASFVIISMLDTGLKIVEAENLTEALISAEIMFENPKAKPAIEKSIETQKSKGYKYPLNV